MSGRFFLEYLVLEIIWRKLLRNNISIIAMHRLNFDAEAVQVKVMATTQLPQL